MSVETLETIAAKIDALGKSMEARFAQVEARFVQVEARFAQVDDRFAQVDGRFAQVDGRFDQTKDSLKAELRVEIEAVNANVNRVYDAVIAQSEANKANAAEHRAFGQRLESHEVRILALEQRKRARR